MILTKIRLAQPAKRSPFQARRPTPHLAALSHTKSRFLIYSGAGAFSDFTVVSTAKPIKNNSAIADIPIL
jgi:hypothetical protein